MHRQCVVAQCLPMHDVLVRVLMSRYPNFNLGRRPIAGSSYILRAVPRSTLRISRTAASGAHSTRSRYPSAAAARAPRHWRTRAGSPWRARG